MRQGRTDEFIYPNGDIFPQPGDTFILTILAGKDTISASTIVPQPPLNMEATCDTFYLDSLYNKNDSIGNSLTGYCADNLDNYGITIEWDNPMDDENYYFLSLYPHPHVKNINPYPLNDRNSYQTSPMSKWCFNKFKLTFQTITDINPYFSILNPISDYELVIFRILPEMAQLYDTENIKWGNQEISFSNIQNSMGIFTSMASDTFRFHIKGLSTVLK